MVLLHLLLLIAVIPVIVLPLLVNESFYLLLFLLLLVPLQEVLLGVIHNLFTCHVEHLVNLDHPPQHLDHEVPLQLLLEVLESPLIVLEELLY